MLKRVYNCIFASALILALVFVLVFFAVIDIAYAYSTEYTDAGDPFVRIEVGEVIEMTVPSNCTGYLFRLENSGIGGVHPYYLWENKDEVEVYIDNVLFTGLYQYEVSDGYSMGSTTEVDYLNFIALGWWDSDLGGSTIRIVPTVDDLLIEEWKVKYDDGTSEAMGLSVLPNFIYDNVGFEFISPAYLVENDEAYFDTMPSMQFGFTGYDYVRVKLKNIAREQVYDYLGAGMHIIQPDKFDIEAGEWNHFYFYTPGGDLLAHKVIYIEDDIYIPPTDGDGTVPDWNPDIPQPPEAPSSDAEWYEKLYYGLNAIAYWIIYPFRYIGSILGSLVQVIQNDFIELGNFSQAIKEVLGFLPDTWVALIMMGLTLGIMLRVVGR